LKIELDISEPYAKMLEEMREEMSNADEQIARLLETSIHKNYQNFKRMRSGKSESDK